MQLPGVVPVDCTGAPLQPYDGALARRDHGHRADPGRAQPVPDEVAGGGEIGFAPPTTATSVARSSPSGRYSVVPADSSQYDMDTPGIAFMIPIYPIRISYT